MTKRFGRPAPTEPKRATGGPIRAINLPRETGSPLEGAYAVASARESMRIEPDAAWERMAYARGAKFWLVMLVFWVLVCLGWSSVT